MFYRIRRANGGSPKKANAGQSGPQTKTKPEAENERETDCSLRDQTAEGRAEGFPETEAQQDGPQACAENQRSSTKAADGSAGESSQTPP